MKSSRSQEGIGRLLYGPNSDPDMIEAITGETPLWISKTALMPNVELCVQKLSNIPDVPIVGGGPSVRSILRNNYGDDFEAYAMRPAPGKMVRGLYVELSRLGSDRMVEWDLTGDWFKAGEAEAVVIPGDGNGMVSAATTYLGEGQTFDRIVETGTNYPLFLTTSKEAMTEVATNVRLSSNQDS